LKRSAQTPVLRKDLALECAIAPSA
jgi:hypothetical protein